MLHFEHRPFFTVWFAPHSEYATVWVNSRFHRLQQQDQLQPCVNLWAVLCCAVLAPPTHLMCVFPTRTPPHPTHSPCRSCSVKDRIAYSMISAAEEQGLISPGKTLLVRQHKHSSGFRASNSSSSRSLQWQQQLLQYQQ